MSNVADSSSMSNKAYISDNEDTKENTDQSNGEDIHESLEKVHGEAKLHTSRLGLIEIKCVNRLRQGLYILGALCLMIIIPTVIWYSIKAGKIS